MMEPAELVFAVAVEDDRRLLLAGVVAQQLAADKLVHGEVGLMEPEPAQNHRPPIPAPPAGRLSDRTPGQHLLNTLRPCWRNSLSSP